MATISSTEFVYTIYTIINVTISTVIGLKIASKYIAYKRKELLTVGLSMVFTAAIWWAIIIAFLTVIFLNYEPNLTFLLAFHLFTPLSMILWVYSISLLIYPKSFKKIMLIFGIICSIYVIIFLYFLLTDPGSLGRKTGTIFAEFYLYIVMFSLFSLIVYISTAILFLDTSLKSSDPRIRWKGKFIFLSATVFVFTTFVSIIIPATGITLLYLFANICSYIGWLMPDKIAKFLIKEKESSE